MYFCQPLIQLPQTVPHLSRRDHFDLSAETADPAIELVADADGHVKVEAALPFRHKDGRGALFSSWKAAVALRTARH